ncbi:hypothetical protein HYH03_015652 [Edaphochlamys debaryana]|uniref:Fucosyltransferase n=1 Tax=Edaphochlamys debaryana TaxID=47281 RepID=A0A836BR05_9CHLO|nr:hypothetical protein HYH03_015652 [Edaphochlamys debaryana]|eukprot:KAG2485680.1 hypothetical protein HYH03_015652 [Edaphochlamys debaryana]
MRPDALPSPRYSVMLSDNRGLGDRLRSSLTVFAHVLLSNRTYELVWYGKHQLWYSFQSPWIDWRAPPHLRIARFPREGGRPNGTVLPVVTENHHWANPNRSVFDSFCTRAIDPGFSQYQQNMTKRFETTDMTKYGGGRDVVLWTGNQGYARHVLSNPLLQERVKELGLSAGNLASCLFNFLYVPTPRALAPFRQKGMYDILLDPHNYIIGIQIRVGDHAFLDNRKGVKALNGSLPGQAHFACAQQLREQLESLPEFGGVSGQAEHSRASGGKTMRRRQAAAPVQPLGRGTLLLSASGGGELDGDVGEEDVTEEAETAAAGEAEGKRVKAEIGQDPAAGAAAARPRRVYWFLLSDSEAARHEALSRYGSSGRLLVAEGLALDHINKQPGYGQESLHVGAGEMWLFGLASAHVVAVGSTYGWLGALAGVTEAKPMRMWGITSNQPRPCRLDQPDPAEAVESWSGGL